MSEKVVIFDLGKVIFDYDVKKIPPALSLYSSSKKIFEDMDEFMNDNKLLFIKYEIGEISSINFYKSIINLLDIKSLSFEKFSDIWNEIFTPMQEVIDLINSLSYRYELAVLSNTNELHFDYLYKKYPDLFVNFKKLHLSYLMNSRKPDAGIYKQIIKTYNIKPENIFFTDDKEENVYAAMLNGIKAFTFKNATKLIQDLESFGIEV